MVLAARSRGEIGFVAVGQAFLPALIVKKNLRVTRMADRNVCPTCGTYMSRRISAAAFLPQMPITPPPGWLAAPHKYRPRIGER
jgi:hypothetical protein